VERKKGERYSREFRVQAVQRMKACDNILRLSRELGIHRRLLHNWRDRLVRCEEISVMNPVPTHRAIDKGSVPSPYSYRLCLSHKFP